MCTEVKIFYSRKSVCSQKKTGIVIVYTIAFPVNIWPCEAGIQRDSEIEKRVGGMHDMPYGNMAMGMMQGHSAGFTSSLLPGVNYLIEYYIVNRII